MHSRTFVEPVRKSGPEMSHTRPPFHPPRPRTIIGSSRPTVDLFRGWWGEGGVGVVRDGGARVKGWGEGRGEGGKRERVFPSAYVVIMSGD